MKKDDEQIIARACSKKKEVRILTFLVFVAYGGDEAKQEAELLGAYLERIGVSTFVASSRLGKWLIPGQHNFNLRIWDQLQKSDIMVLVSTRKTIYSKKVREEVIDTISKRKPIIVLKKTGTKIPFSKKLRDVYWIPDLDYDPNNLTEIFPEVAIHILRNMEQLAEDQLQISKLEEK